ncbi:hypothetical protein COU59_00285 [Candidatus Pacearchaeota archaeon CG10_big_fil_rev_8_21_14_0_10_34_12]|nr:MAG: hypothetical protein COU59_00285 [Candidatus Pacearchaeota archaeon CG10_big_fil_rev_8_21_14_0_10_34_12]
MAGKLWAIANSAEERINERKRDASRRNMPPLYMLRELFVPLSDLDVINIGRLVTQRDRYEEKLHRIDNLTSGFLLMSKMGLYLSVGKVLYDRFM